MVRVASGLGGNISSLCGNEKEGEESRSTGGFEETVVLEFSRIEMAALL
ncbi:hypothetical protein COLO4_06811 [Corchorus olitorius]|uniref:Uncharacterized protein n=1 Tax=Corchorus olitorius TaxID=93759 RepID=A0A1R3KLU6_9ROSI|nr:hypothetical protein COLO4_06811 [Corchorus olitorius]